MNDGRNRARRGRHHCSEGPETIRYRQRTAGRPARYVVERLENRTLLAFDLTLSTGGTANVSASTASGTTTFNATATGATLSWLDVESALTAGNSVIITSGSGGTESGDIIDQTGMDFPPLTTPNLKLTIQSGTGTGLVGNIRIYDINLNGPSSSIVLDAQGNLSTGLLSGGSFGHPTQLSSATLIAATGSVTALSSPLPGPIEATTVAIQASTGIGTSAAPLQTQTGNLSAGTATGGIFVSNTGNLNITGGVIPGVNGIQAATSGDIVLTNAGNFTATTNGDIVSALDNVSITTTAAGDILLGGDSSAGAVTSRGADVTLSAAGNLLIGNTADPIYGSSYGAVLGRYITLAAGGNIIDTNSLVESFSGGRGLAITATAGGNISVLSANISQTGFITWSGAISLITGPGGTFTINGPATLNTTLLNGNGNISINADHVVLNTIPGAIFASSGTVSIQPVTPSEAIQLGTTTDAELDLSNAELAMINALFVQVGSPADSGNVTVTAAINPPGVQTLYLQTGGPVTDAEPVDTITAYAVLASAGAGISLDTAATYLAFRNTSAGDIRIANAGGFTILGMGTLFQKPDNQSGNQAPGGTVTLSIGNSSTGNTLAVDTALVASGGTTLSGGSGNDTFQFNFSSGASLPTPLTINSGGGKDLIALKYTTGNPLPAEIHLNGLFTISGLVGSNPLANTTLDIGTSTVWISYAAGADPIASLQSDIANGYNGGAWDGSPMPTLGVITSSAAQSDPLHNTAVGFSDSADGTGVSPIANTIEIKYTVYGDANLDGTADLADLLSFVRHFGQPRGWDAGDFNYDVTTTLTDFLVLTRHFGQSVPASATLAATIVESTTRKRTLRPVRRTFG